MNDSALNPEPASPLAAELSAVMDGEADGEAVERVSRAWRQDGRTRADWQAYHLIGDVLRTPDLAGDPAAQARLLHRVQDRLASEPAWMLPAPALAYADATAAPEADAALTARHGRRPSWLRRATA
ncbi:MAG: sigma-E factor negative regulatory protein, partial [Leptothrix sp. (in: b-proteobacteria)]